MHDEHGILVTDFTLAHASNSDTQTLSSYGILDYYIH